MATSIHKGVVCLCLKLCFEAPSQAEQEDSSRKPTTTAQNEMLMVGICNCRQTRAAIDGFG